MQNENGDQTTLISILGPTASGKTALAVHLAKELSGEIISADSRQVYKGMDLGTGKDLSEYSDLDIPYHLIDILEAGAEYNLFSFLKDFLRAFEEIENKHKKIIFCGGTGLYLSAVLERYELVEVMPDLELKRDLEMKSLETLVSMLKSYGGLHNKTDIEDKERCIKSIEIEKTKKEFPERIIKLPNFKYKVFGLEWERSVLRERIQLRLKQRLEAGMIEEVEGLIKKGVSHEQLCLYGLEYKFVTMYIKKELSYNDMFQKLNTAICKFSKRQGTWFRKMEKKGIKIEWIKGDLPLNQQIAQIRNLI